MMIDLPESTRVHKRMPKELFYKHLKLSNRLKSSFISDISNIFVEWDIKNSNLNITNDSDVKEILFLKMELKRKKYDYHIIETIARQNAHKLIFILFYENEVQLGVYYNKLYLTKWENENDLQLTIKGLNLDEIWANIVKQIGLNLEFNNGVIQSESNDQQSLDEQLERKEKIDKLQKQIDKTEKMTWKAQQPKKKLELYQKLEKYKKQLEDLKNGKA